MKKEQKTKKKLKVKKLFNIKQNPKSLAFLDFFCYNMDIITRKGEADVYIFIGRIKIYEK